ncbi:MAG: GNAT family N-acetyltransferase [Rhodobacteraceae bacterium]|nr:GNAT family N-acetyltransferase [Alphaproteobacteria bacterium]NNK67060.1 GNAT family N-acetyltransferase [Paracoccaceae bacterium]
MSVAADLAAIHASAFTEGRAWSAAEFTKLLNDPTTLVMRIGPAFVLGRVVADEAEILTLATAPASRRKGHARACLSAFEESCAQRGALSVFLEVAETNMPARQLYASGEYREAGRRPGYYPRADGPPVDALILRKDLSVG